MKDFVSLRLILCLIGIFLLGPDLKAQEPATAIGKFQTANGLKIYYEETGHGMPLLLLHGFGRTCSIWRPFILELSKHYRVISIDLPGHGRSDCMDTTDVYLHKRAAQYILSFLDSLHIDSLNILGSSAGSFITLYMATMDPSLAKNIVIIGSQLYYSDLTRRVLTAEKNPSVTSENYIKIHGKQKGMLIARQFWNFRKLYGDPSFTPDVLSTIKARTLIVHGDNDPIAPVRNAWEMYQSIPHANLWVVPNGGHVPYLIADNQPEFSRVILQFLQGNWD